MATVIATATLNGKKFNKVAELNHSNQYFVSIWIEDVGPGGNVADSYLEFETSGGMNPSWYEIQSSKLREITVVRS